MSSGPENKFLKNIPVKDINRNPENPRLFFRQQEIEELTESIRRFGVQVPISLYKEGKKYVLLDGERRLRCSIKLNKKTIPAIIQDKPDAYTNLVLMFNIHALREQWDLLTLALKLPRVVALYEKKHGSIPNEKELSEETGLSRSVIRRCRLLMNLPKHHIDVIKSELKKPKSEQRTTEDFYIEMERALTAVSRSLPAIIPDEKHKEEVRQVLLEKYRKKIINNIVDFRKIAKVARAEAVNVDPGVAIKELKKLFKSNNYTIKNAFERSVSEAYSERDLKTHVESLIEDLESLESTELDTSLLDLLKQLIDAANQVLRKR